MMSFIVVLIFVILGNSFGSPIGNDSIEFENEGCFEHENNSTFEYILRLTSNLTDDCVKVEESSLKGNQTYYYILPSADERPEIKIKTDNCSIPLPNIHLSLCHDDQRNSNEEIFPLPFQIIKDEQDNTTESSTDFSSIYTGPTVYETAHQFNEDEDEQLFTLSNPTTQINQKKKESEQSSEDD